MFSIFQVWVMLIGMGIGILTAAKKLIFLPLAFLVINLLIMVAGNRGEPLSTSVEAGASLFVLICLAFVIPEPHYRN